MPVNLPDQPTPQSQEFSGYRRVLAYLRDLLISGALKTGDRLPSERELALRLDVSRPAVREGLRALEMIGVLETRHGRASTVRVPDAVVLGEFFSLALAQQPAALDDILEVRIALERQAVRLACSRANEEDRKELIAALQQIERTIDDDSRGGAADFAFHTRIVAAAHSPSLATIYETITHLLEKSHVERRRRMGGNAMTRAFLVDHHREILKAIEAGDAALADDLMLRHFAIGASIHQQAAKAQTN